MASDRGVRAATGDLELEGVTKQFDSFVAVADLSLRVPRGSFFALLGPSGCGKTTTLRMVAGLEQPTRGTLSIGGTDITYTRPYQRPVNTVFQSYALFPHLDIYENVAFGLRRRGRKDVADRVQAVLSLIQLDHVARRKPGQLSGGQQQRVALARAIVNQPEVLLLDEPLGALDLKLRRQMQIELKRIQTEVGLTFIHVTHDQEEAMTMADTVAVMNAGRIEQMGSPVELYNLPRTAFVANFLGQSNLVHGDVVDRSGVHVDVHGSRIRIPAARVTSPEGRLLVGVRPEKLHVHRHADEAPAGHNVLGPVTVGDASFVGVSTQYLVRTRWGQLLSVFAQNLHIGAGFRAGDEIVLSWDPEHTFALDGGEDANAGMDPELVVPEAAPAGVS